MKSASASCRNLVAQQLPMDRNTCFAFDTCSRDSLICCLLVSVAGVGMRVLSSNVVTMKQTQTAKMNQGAESVAWLEPVVDLLAQSAIMESVSPKVRACPCYGSERSDHADVSSSLPTVCCPVRVAECGEWLQRVGCEQCLCVTIIGSADSLLSQPRLACAMTVSMLACCLCGCVD